MSFSYDKLKSASEHVLKLLSDVIGLNTLFVAVNDGDTNVILKALNRQEVLAEEGSVLPLVETYCSLVTRNRGQSVTVSSTMDFVITSGMGITKKLGDTSFIGVPIMLGDQTICGTICGMDNHGYQYSAKDIEMLNAMATFLSYIVELEHVAFRDSLTNTFNRGFIDVCFDTNWKSKYETLGVVFVDIDNFKDLNDTYGHAFGDAILQITAQNIQACVRKSDMVFRLGGDEFVAVILNYDDENVLTRIAMNLLDTFRKSLNVEDNDVFVSVSVGVSMYPNDGEEIDELIHKADAAMYQVKQKGKAGYQFSRSSLNSESTISNNNTIL